MVRPAADSGQGFEAKYPFREWLGPYSPSRGSDHGFRVRGGELVCYRKGRWSTSEWRADGEGVSELVELVARWWQGGRIMILPDGHVIKPLRDEDTGRRVLIGRIRGHIFLEGPDGDELDLCHPELDPGAVWEAPHSIGLECTIGPERLLRASSQRAVGREIRTEEFTVYGPDASLYRAFRTARRAHLGGRVHVLYGGAVLTYAKVGSLPRFRYLGQLDVARWPYDRKWVGRRSVR